MFNLDFFFGNQDFGHLKLFLISGLIGLSLSSFGFGDAESQNKYYYILLGFPIWYLVRAVYGYYRQGELEDMKIEATESPESEKLRLQARLKRHSKSVFANNPQLWDKLLLP